MLFEISGNASLMKTSYSGVTPFDVTLGIAPSKSFLISFKTSLSERSFKLAGFCSIKLSTRSTIVASTPSCRGTSKFLKTLGPLAKSCVVSVVGAAVSSISLASLVSIVVVFFFLSPS